MTPRREKDTFVCRVGFGRTLSRRSSANQPRASSKRTSWTRIRPSIMKTRRSRGLVHPRPCDQGADLGQRLLRARVFPPAADAMAGERAARGVVAVDVRDLELAARGRPEAANH